MKYFGTVKAFDQESGRGSIEPDTGGADLSFAQLATSWNRVAPPRPGQRLAYDLHHTHGQPALSTWNPSNNRGGSRLLPPFLELIMNDLTIRETARNALVASLLTLVVIGSAIAFAIR